MRVEYLISLVIPNIKGPIPTNEWSTQIIFYSLTNGIGNDRAAHPLLGCILGVTSH